MLLSHMKLLFLFSASLVHSVHLPYPSRGHDRAAYFLDSDTAGNQLISLKISPDDGTLSSPVRTFTGGKGLSDVIAGSSNSVVVSGNYIFVVNSASNTVSLLAIDPKDPYHPKLLGQPQPTLGETPITVAYSPKLKTACVANAGTTAGITCFSVSPTRGLTPLGPLRLLPQTQKADPLPALPGPLILISDIAFNPSSTALFVDFRSNGALPGSIYAFPISASGDIGRTGVRSQFPDLPAVFTLNFLAEGGATRISDERLIVTDPIKGLAGAALLEVEYPSLQVKQTKLIELPGQVAACWVAYNPKLSKSAYVIDAGLTRVDIVDPGTGALENRVGYASGPVAVVNATGGQDAKLDRDWLYLVTDAQQDPKINVFKVGGPKGAQLQLVQRFDIFSQVGRIPQWAGLAIWSSL